MKIVHSIKYSRKTYSKEKTLFKYLLLCPVEYRKSLNVWSDTRVSKMM